MLRDKAFDCCLFDIAMAVAGIPTISVATTAIRIRGDFVVRLIKRSSPRLKWNTCLEPLDGVGVPEANLRVWSANV